jgi:hypothetical protein
VPIISAGFLCGTWDTARPDRTRPRPTCLARCWLEYVYDILVGGIGIFTTRDENVQSAVWSGPWWWPTIWSWSVWPAPFRTRFENALSDDTVGDFYRLTIFQKQRVFYPLVEKLLAFTMTYAPSFARAELLSEPSKIEIVSSEVPLKAAFR